MPLEWKSKTRSLWLRLSFYCLAKEAARNIAHLQIVCHGIHFDPTKRAIGKTMSRFTCSSRWLLAMPWCAEATTSIRLFMTIKVGGLNAKKPSKNSLWKFVSKGFLCSKWTLCGLRTRERLSTKCMTATGALKTRNDRLRLVVFLFCPVVASVSVLPNLFGLLFTAAASLSACQASPRPLIKTTWLTIAPEKSQIRRNSCINSCCWRMGRGARFHWRKSCPNPLPTGLDVLYRFSHQVFRIP